jgi:hypothetical protein
VVRGICHGDCGDRCVCTGRLFTLSSCIRLLFRTDTNDLAGGARRGKGAMVTSHTGFVLKEGPAGWGGLPTAAAELPTPPRPPEPRGPTGGRSCSLRLRSPQPRRAARARAVASRRRCRRRPPPAASPSPAPPSSASKCSNSFFNDLSAPTRRASRSFWAAPPLLGIGGINNNNGEPSGTVHTQPRCKCAPGSACSCR